MVEVGTGGGGGREGCLAPSTAKLSPPDNHHPTHPRLLTHPASLAPAPPGLLPQQHHRRLVRGRGGDLRPSPGLHPIHRRCHRAVNPSPSLLHLLLRILVHPTLQDKRKVSLGWTVADIFQRGPTLPVFPTGDRDASLLNLDVFSGSPRLLLMLNEPMADILPVCGGVGGSGTEGVADSCYVCRRQPSCESPPPPGNKKKYRTAASTQSARLCCPACSIQTSAASATSFLRTASSPASACARCRVERMSSPTPRQLHNSTQQPPPCLAYQDHSSGHGAQPAARFARSAGQGHCACPHHSMPGRQPAHPA